MNEFCNWSFNETERELYRQLTDGIKHSAHKIELASSSPSVVTDIIRAVLIDHPEFFWFDGRIKPSKTETGMLIQPHYLYGAYEIARARAQIEAVAEALLERVNAGEYEKAKTAYDWLLTHVRYAPESSGQTIYDVFIHRKAVCKGLSKAYQYLLGRLGVFSTLAYGTIDGTTRHIWNVVRVEDEYYNVDVSTACAQFDSLFDATRRGDRYRAFLKPDSKMIARRIPQLREQTHAPCSKTYHGGAMDNA